ncbi:hypothetical protein AB1Y20_016123 [Prymnesium parvum]|uniref:Uncharacterized protein n=1 Tax=Prymnesium parvum TaxID=97485 RepID=A0AB34K2G2_PRYPA
MYLYPKKVKPPSRLDLSRIRLAPPSPERVLTALAPPVARGRALRKRSGQRLSQGLSRMLQTACVGTLLAISCHLLLLVLIRLATSPSLPSSRDFDAAARRHSPTTPDLRRRSPSLRDLLRSSALESEGGGSKLRDSKWPKRGAALAEQPPSAADAPAKRLQQLFDALEGDGGSLRGSQVARQVEQLLSALEGEDTPSLSALEGEDTPRREEPRERRPHEREASRAAPSSTAAESALWDAKAAAPAVAEALAELSAKLAASPRQEMAAAEGSMHAEMQRTLASLRQQAELLQKQNERTERMLQRVLLVIASMAESSRAASDGAPHVAAALRDASEVAGLSSIIPPASTGEAGAGGAAVELSAATVPTQLLAEQQMHLAARIDEQRALLQQLLQRHQPELSPPLPRNAEGDASRPVASGALDALSEGETAQARTTATSADGAEPQSAGAGRGKPVGIEASSPRTPGSKRKKPLRSSEDDWEKEWEKEDEVQMSILSTSDIAGESVLAKEVRALLESLNSRQDEAASKPSKKHAKKHGRAKATNKGDLGSAVESAVTKDDTAQSASTDEFEIIDVE